MDTKKVIGSNNLKAITLIIGAILIALVSFAAGMNVGFYKAKFSYKWGENYERNFIGPPPSRPGPMGLFHDFPDRDFRNAHGLAGRIISIADNNLIIQDRDNKENTVAVTDKTIIKQRGNDLRIGDLKQDDEIIIVGNPDESGVVNADLIRVFNKSE